MNKKREERKKEVWLTGEQRGRMTHEWIEKEWRRGKGMKINDGRKGEKDGRTRDGGQQRERCPNK